VDSDTALLLEDRVALDFETTLAAIITPAFYTVTPLRCIGSWANASRCRIGEYRVALNLKTTLASIVAEPFYAITPLGRVGTRAGASSRVSKHGVALDFKTALATLIARLTILPCRHIGTRLSCGLLEDGQIDLRADIRDCAVLAAPGNLDVIGKDPTAVIAPGDVTPVELLLAPMKCQRAIFWNRGHDLKARSGSSAHVHISTRDGILGCSIARQGQCSEKCSSREKIRMFHLQAPFVAVIPVNKSSPQWFRAFSRSFPIGAAQSSAHALNDGAKAVSASFSSPLSLNTCLLPCRLTQKRDAG
jgi:hypothetical protein